MYCPKCGQLMTQGAIDCYRGDGMVCWLPHPEAGGPWLLWSVSAVEKRGGMAIHTCRSLAHRPSQSYACPACKVVVVDCQDSP